MLEPISEVVLEHYCLWPTDNCCQPIEETRVPSCTEVLFVLFYQTIHFPPLASSLRGWTRGRKSLCLRSRISRSSVLAVCPTQTLSSLLSSFPQPSGSKAEGGRSLPAVSPSPLEVAGCTFQSLCFLQPPLPVEPLPPPGQPLPDFATAPHSSLTRLLLPFDTVTKYQKAFLRDQAVIASKTWFFSPTLWPCAPVIRSSESTCVSTPPYLPLDTCSVHLPPQPSPTLLLAPESSTKKRSLSSLVGRNSFPGLLFSL